MTLKTIVACLTKLDGTESVVSSALSIAKQHEAHVIGFHAIPRIPAYGLSGMDFPAEVIQQDEARLRERADKIENEFRKVANKTGNAQNPSTEWLRREGPLADLSSSVLRCLPDSDLVVMNQFPISEDYPDVAAEIVIGSGRPALLIPEKSAAELTVKRAVIGWSATREARRATFDAIPLLKRADSVSILSIVAQHDSGEKFRSSARDLANALSRHGIDTECDITVAANISAGDALLSRIADEARDLLVMGCYGHARFREMLFGGVTNHILRHMTVPVLISH